MDLRTATGVITSAQPTVNGLPRWLTYVRLCDVTAADRNPKLHDLPAIKDSISTYGFGDPPEVDERTGQLVAGHGRIEALVEIRQEGRTMPNGIVIDEDGEWLVPLYRGWRSRTDTEAEAYGLAQNVLPEKGGYHNKTMAQVLEDVVTEDPGLLDTLSYTSDDVDSMLRRYDPEKMNTELNGGEVGAPPPLGKDEDTDLADLDSKPAPEANVICPACAHRFPLAPGR